MVETANRPGRHPRDDIQADIPPMTWGPTVISCENKPNCTRRHDGWELLELTDRGKKIDSRPDNTARGELEAPVGALPKAFPAVP